MGRYAGWIALQRRRGVRRPRHPDPRDPVRPRAGGGDDRPARAARRASSRSSSSPRARHRRAARCPCSARRSARPRSSAASARSWPGASSSSPARRPAPSCSATCCAAAPRRRSTACSGCASAPPPCGRLDEGESGVMVALNPPNVYYVPIAEATSRLKSVPLDCDTMLTARDMGINFGDAMPLADDPAELGRAVNALGGVRRTSRSLSNVTQHHGSHRRPRVRQRRRRPRRARRRRRPRRSRPGPASSSRSPGSPCATCRASRDVELGAGRADPRHRTTSSTTPTSTSSSRSSAASSRPAS